MTGPQFKAWRTAEGLSLREVSEDRLHKRVSQPTLSRWEQSEDHMPEWASDMLLNATTITLPLAELHQLLDYCRDNDLAFNEVVGKAIREHLNLPANKPLDTLKSSQAAALASSVLMEQPITYHAASQTEQPPNQEDLNAELSDRHE